MARRKPTPNDDSSAPSFEDALASLEAIVEAMEHEQLPLEELVAYYENGSALLDRCESILQSARGRIELITLRNKNESEPDTETTDFPQPSGTPDESDDDDDNDIRLF
ncbi:MAG: exodeoxyribonuclease VII small subunit [Gloeobacteraceae cyanobacterium ES-bin-144]|nr:exodeoxyribonuclease VII small subunit [Verrucomicrobiales bacterium]